MVLGTAADGSVLAAWDSRRQDRGTYGVCARVVSARGAALTPEIRVNEYWPGAQHAPAVAVEDSGAAWIAWTSHGQDGEGTAVVARRYGRLLSSPYPEIVVNATSEGSQFDVALAVSSSGTLAAWVHEGDAGRRGIRGRLLASGGIPAGDEIVIGCTDGREAAPCVASDPRGGFVVAWGCAAASGAPLGIVARRVDDDGGLVGEELWLDGCGGLEPSVAVADDGTLFAAWLVGAEDGYSARARWFTPDGHAMNDTIGLGAAGAGGASAAIDPRGGAGLIAFHTSGATGGGTIMCAQVAVDGTRSSCVELLRGARGSVGQRFAGGTGASRIAWLRDGSLACTWEGDGGLADRSAAHLSLVQPPAVSPSGDGRIVALSGEAAPNDDGASPDHEPPVWDPAFRAQPPLESSAQGSSAFGFEGVPGTAWAPPDADIAVGPGHLVLVTNGQIAFFDKNGLNTLRQTLGAEGNPGFWEPVGCGGFLFDPEVLYDQHSGRFWAMAAERATGSYFCLAVSDDENPNGTWHKYRLNVTPLAGSDIDSPNLAVGADAVYMTADFFLGGDKHLVFMLPKSPLVQGQPAPSGTSLLIAGTQSYGLARGTSPGAPAQYMLQSTELVSNNTVTIHGVRGALSTPARDVFVVAVPEYQFPAPPPQQGSAVSIMLFEPRFWSCIERDGSLWGVHHVRSATSGGRAVVRWYEFALHGWPAGGQTPVLRQWGELDPGPGLHAYFPVIAVNGSGTAAITFARSGTAEFISMWRAVRRYGDPLGTFRPMELVRTSTAPYTAVGRWGDYGGSQADPVEGCTIWAHHEFTTSPSAWRTWVSRYRLYARADMNEDCALTIADFGAFQSLFELADMRADFTGDGQHTIADFGAFQSSYAMER